MLEESPFAEGGGGQVFRGTFRGSVICAKRVFGSSMGDFEQEVSVLTTLSHPHVLSLYGVVQVTDGDPLMVTEYCGGGDLDGCE